MMIAIVFRPVADVVITIKSGKARCVKGTVSNHVLHDISDVCREKQVKSAEVHVSSVGKIKLFGMPKKYHQRIKNVVSSRP